MNIKGFFWLLFWVSLVNGQSFYEKSPHIIELTPKTFRKVIHETNYTTLVEFYAPWCGHCQQLKGIMERVARNLDGIVQVASVNCDLAKNKQLCAQHRIQGFPTLMVFRPPKVDLNKAPEDAIRLGNHASEIYKGERKLRAIADFSVSRVKNYVRRISKVNTLIDILQKEQSRYSAVLFAKKDKISPLFKSLALDWLGTIDFYTIPISKLDAKAQVSSTNASNITSFVQKFSELEHKEDKSVLVLFDNKEDRYYIFEDKLLNKLDIAMFLSQFAEPTEGPLTKRQEFIDSLKQSKKSSKKRSTGRNSKIEHDEL
ncbi:LAFE_0E06502g1_1 [Lachancea fermentati]|uniref:LAFE_0E06502g1_1 n=1 Tax=Lachancea fermentati TaxID=4955 RepID=A0A1G4MCW9_LACFM|nr:LAFE_0E06502g1_1 [Lachancea fermentati]